MEYRYTLKHGDALKRAEAENDYHTALVTLVDCYKEIHKAFPEEYEEFYLDMDLFDTNDFFDTLQNYKLYRMDWESAVNCAKGQLEEFYNLCEEMGIRVC